MNTILEAAYVGQIFTKINAQAIQAIAAGTTILVAAGIFAAIKRFVTGSIGGAISVAIAIAIIVGLINARDVIATAVTGSF